MRQSLPEKQNLASCFIRSVKGLAMIEKLRMNLRKYPTRPRKLCNCFWFVGRGNFVTAFVLSSEMLINWFSVQWPRNSIFFFRKQHFFKLITKPYSLQRLTTVLRLDTASTSSAAGTMISST